MLLQEHVAQMLKPNVPLGRDDATKTFQPESGDEEEMEGQEEEEEEEREEERERDKGQIEEVSTDSSRGDTTDDSGSDE